MKITVMLGGPSAEREVSLRSGAAAIGALRALGHDVEALDPVDDTWTLPVGTEVVFLALHGTYGEDGTVQRRLEALGVPYTGCDSESSRVAFDKVLTKQRCLANGVPTSPFVVLTDPAAAWPAGWQPPVVLKPVRQGSSVGLHFVESPDQLAAALGSALEFDSEVLMEQQVLGREATVGILEDRALPVVEVEPKQGVLDYNNKYTKGATNYYCPGRFDARTTERIQAAALGAFRAVGGRDYARVDVMVRPDGSPVVLEVNTLPGMTETSLLPKAAALVGLDFPALCSKMVAMALQRPALNPSDPE
jgi:D-alanine-D-alanine ligase